MLNERIKQLRIAAGISQVTLAEKLGVTKQCVSNWENDNIQPSIEMLIKLARFFHVTCDHLLGMDDAMLLDVSGLSSAEIAHLQFLIGDLKQHPKE